MKKSLKYFFNKNCIDGKKKIIISIDLDNTLVIRKKGSNYINPRIKKIIKILIKNRKINLVPNTGRDLVGFSAFQNGGLNIKNGVFGSGSLIMNNGHIFFNQKSNINPFIIKLFIDAVSSGILPFIDLSHAGGRIIYYGHSADKYYNLFFSQNPRDWCHKKYSVIKHVRDYDSKKLNKVFRVEFPLIKSDSAHEKLFNHISIKDSDSIKYLYKLLGTKSGKIFEDYSLKNKKYFNNHYSSEDIIFARFGKNFDFVNKGAGLKIWLKKSSIMFQDCTIIHVGDKDVGLINDTLIKDDLPNALIVMVGKKYNLDNPVVDLHLRGNTEKLLLDFFVELSKILVK
ncbi:MAG: hypothetical protein WCW66_05630 [Patescibacteria group bacterium]